MYDYSDIQMSESDLIVRQDEYPQGLLCGKCEREIHQGERYSTLLQGFVEETPLTLVVCASCGLAPT